MDRHEAVFETTFGLVSVILKVDPRGVPKGPSKGPKVKLTRAQVETAKACGAEKIRALYGNPDAEVLVTRWYGTSFAPFGEGDLYVAKVEVVGGQCFTAIGHTELRALRALYRQMELVAATSYPKGFCKGVTRP